MINQKSFSSTDCRLVPNNRHGWGRWLKGVDYGDLVMRFISALVRHIRLKLSGLFARQRRPLPPPYPFPMDHVERRFHTAFHMLPGNRKADLLRFYQRKHGCSWSEAMERAIEDRARDNGLRM